MVFSSLIPHPSTASRCILTLLLFVLSACEPVFAAEFGPIYRNTIKPHEGGFTANRNDPGNWTGGKVGKGKLLGTNRGIAANTYGLELLRKGKTIKGLTDAECETLYKRDYFDSKALSALKSQGIADELCDEIVNMGEGGGRALLAKQFQEIGWATGKAPPVMPEFSWRTMEWINRYTENRSNRIAFYNGIRMKRVKFYVNLVHRKPKMAQFFRSWIDRTVD
jgi:lysozyme family protein